MLMSIKLKTGNLPSNRGLVNPEIGTLLEGVSMGFHMKWLAER
jgi:hypothetical protein